MKINKVLFLSFILFSSSLSGFSQGVPSKFSNRFKIDNKNGKLIFLSTDGSVLKEQPLKNYLTGQFGAPNVVFSENGKFVCVQTTLAAVPDEENGLTATKLNLTVLDDKGNEIWSIDNDFNGYPMVSPICSSRFFC